MKPQYSMRATPAPGSAEILLYGEIGSWGITALQFAEDLKALGDVSRLTIRINSPGGSVAEGMAMYSALRDHPATKTVSVEGVAASMGSVIAMAGDTVIMQAGSLMMIHDPRAWLDGPTRAEELRRSADVLDKMKAGAVAAYKAKTGLPEDEIGALMDAETWMTPEEAVALGFADAIGCAVDATACADLSRFPKAPKMRAKRPDPGPGRHGTAAMDAAALLEACAERGYPELAAGLMRAGASAEAVATRLDEAAAIAQACDLTNTPATMRAALVGGGITLAAARAVIAEHRAAVDGSIVTDTAHRGDGGTQPGRTMIDHKAVYDRINQRGGRNAP